MSRSSAQARKFSRQLSPGCIHSLLHWDCAWRRPVPLLLVSGAIPRSTFCGCARVGQTGDVYRDQNPAGRAGAEGGGRYRRTALAVPRWRMSRWRWSSAICPRGSCAPCIGRHFCTSSPSGILSRVYVTRLSTRAHPADGCFRGSPLNGRSGNRPTPGTVPVQQCGCNQRELP